MSTAKQIVDELITEIKTSETESAQKIQASGEIIELYDGVAIVKGLKEASFGELIDFPYGLQGMTIDLTESKIAVLVFGDYVKLRIGDRVLSTGRVLSIPVSDKLLGRVVNPLGKTIDGLPNIEPTSYAELEKIAPGIIYRRSVTVPLQTGIKAIDSLIPIGRGQRELIIGDRSTGKTTLALDAIISQKNEQVICIYVAIGQKESKIAQVLGLLKDKDALDYTVVVSASASDSASMQYIAPYAGVAIAEYFLKQGKDVLVVYDDLTKHAWAYRQVSLILKRPAGREAYPGDIFYLHSRLLERACRLDEKFGGGSITALPIIETQEGDISAYIPTNVISITDGQIFLEKELFNAGMRPAINIGASVSRVGSSAQLKAMKQVAGSLKMELAQYRSLAAFSQFASELDEETKKILNRGARMYELLKQGKNVPLPVAKQVVALWLGVKGYTAEIPLAEVSRFEEEALALIATEKSGILESISQEKMITPETEKNLQAFADKFSKMFSKKKA